MGKISIRDTTVEDIPAYRAMHRASWLETYPNNEHGVTEDWVRTRTAAWITPEGIERSKEFFGSVFGNPNHLHQVALDEDKIVGVVHVFKTKENQHLAALYVDKEYYGTGIAQRLMKNVLTWINPRVVTDLEVAVYNERAKAFYRKHGFREKDGSERLFADTIPVVTMERKGEKI